MDRKVDPLGGDVFGLQPETLRAAMARLPSHERRIVKGFYLQDKTANELGIPADIAGDVIKRATEHLRQQAAIHLDSKLGGPKRYAPELVFRPSPDYSTVASTLSSVEKTVETTPAHDVGGSSKGSIDGHLEVGALTSLSDQVEMARPRDWNPADFSKYLVETAKSPEFRIHASLFPDTITISDWLAKMLSDLQSNAIEGRSGWIALGLDLKQNKFAWHNVKSTQTWAIKYRPEVLAERLGWSGIPLSILVKSPSLVGRIFQTLWPRLSTNNRFVDFIPDELYALLRPGSPLATIATVNPEGALFAFKHMETTDAPVVDVRSWWNRSYQNWASALEMARSDTESVAKGAPIASEAAVRHGLVLYKFADGRLIRLDPQRGGDIYEK